MEEKKQSTLWGRHAAVIDGRHLMTPAGFYNAMNELDSQRELAHVHKDSIEEAWESFWKPIVSNEDGTINIEQVKKELADFSFVMEQVPKVYCHITGDMLSKVMYRAEDVIRMADDHFNEALREAVKEEQEENLDKSGFRETIENIIHSAGKHNQEQCTEIADAILREAAPSGEISQDAHEKEVMMNAFNEVRRIFEGRVWIMDGRGSYPYNDDRYREEVRHMYNEFDELHKNTWANIKSHSSEYRQAIIEQYLKEKEEAAPSGERESDAVAFNIYCTDNYYYENGFWWHKENHDPYSVDQLYDIFKQQKEG